LYTGISHNINDNTSNEAVNEEQYFFAKEIPFHTALCYTFADFSLKFFRTRLPGNRYLINTSGDLFYEFYRK